MASEQKRYYWLKLSDDFFKQKEIKKLRSIAGGDTFTIIYLKMLLRSMKDGGKLYYEGIEDDFVSELALDIDEDEDNVAITVQFLTAKGILHQNTVSEYEVLTAAEMTGSECESARRVRKMRATKALELPAGESTEALQCNGDVTTCNTEKEKEKEKERESIERKRATFTPPTIQEVQEYAHEKGYTEREFDPESFVNFYGSKGWVVGKSKMKDWKKAASGWVSRYRKEHPQKADSEERQPQKTPWWQLPLEERQRLMEASESMGNGTM